MPRASADAFVKVNFIADTKKAVRAFSQMHPHLAKLGRVGKLAGMAIAAGIGLAIAAFAALALAVKGALAKYDAYFTGMMKLQRVTGMTARSASTLTGQLRLSGVEADKAGKGFGILATKIYDARQGMLENAAAAKKAAQAGDDFVPKLNTAQKLFANLGVNLRDSRGEFREIGDVIAEVRDRIAALDDRTEQVALAKKLLGRGGQDLLPWLLKTKGEIQALTEKLRDMGMIKGEGAFAAFRTYKKNLRELSLSWDAIRINAAQALVPLINRWLPTVSKGIQHAAKWLNKFANMTQNKGLVEAAKKMIPGVRQVGEWWKRNEKDIRAVGRGILGAAKWAKTYLVPAAKLVGRFFKNAAAFVRDGVGYVREFVKNTGILIGKVVSVAKALDRWTTSGLQAVLNVINAIASAAQRALSYVSSLLQSNVNNPNSGKGGNQRGRGRAFGGLSTGPMSGYTQTLHGTELTIPLNGNPFQPWRNAGYEAGGGSITVNVVVPGGTTLIGTAREVGEIIAPHVARALGREQARAGRRR